MQKQSEKKKKKQQDRGGETEILLESQGLEREKEVNKVCYTNVNGLMSSLLEVEECIEMVKPDILILCEMKWKDEWGIPNIGKGNTLYE